MGEGARWLSPFSSTLAFRLFKQHFTELNDSYWAYVPAANTIESQVKGLIADSRTNPLEFFKIPDKDDGHIASSLNDWRKHFREFSNYSRLNMLVMLSSCFETYLRTVVSLAIESKPGIIFGGADTIDGVALLKANSSYNSYGSKQYAFKNQVDSICQGEWTNRKSAYEKVFLAVPQTVNQNVGLLDDLRRRRNNIAHHFGRVKDRYEAPVFLKPDPVGCTSHMKLLECFGVVYDVASAIDDHLRELIGSYDILLCYRLFEKEGHFKNGTLHEHAKEFQTLMSASGCQPQGKAYYEELLEYYNRI